MTYQEKDMYEATLFVKYAHAILAKTSLGNR